jgi:hypothetical protein
MNHRTTSLLVATAAIATTLVAAGIVAALGSSQFAVAHKEYNKSYDMYDKYGRDNNYGKDRKSDGSQYLKCIVIGGSDGFKRSDGGYQGADQVTIPGVDSGSGGITDNSCNNFDEGSNIPPIPTPIPVGCGTGTVFDATLRQDLSPTLPEGTVLCLQSVGNNQGITAIPPTGPTETANIVVAQVGLSGDCQSAGSGFVRAMVSSGTLPNPLSGDFVCVKTVPGGTP